MKIYRFPLLRAGIPAMALALMTILPACDHDEEPEPPVPDTPINTDARYGGPTRTWPLTDPSDIYESSAGTYYIDCQESDNTLSLHIVNANFLAGMPELGEMTFPGIAYSIDDDGNISFESEALLPEIAGRPFSAFPISDLKGSCTSGSSLEVNFICTYRGTPYQVEFAGTEQ